MWAGDWSSGVCSSDLSGATLNFYYNDTRTFDAASVISGAGTLYVQGGTNTVAGAISTRLTIVGGTLTLNKIGRASCRERVKIDAAANRLRDITHTRTV